MSREILIITPELIEGEGGLADYALRVAEEWGDRIPRKFIAPKTLAQLQKNLPPPGGKILLHYSAYGFDRHGYPRWLLRALLDWKTKSGGLLAIMLHEIWTFWPVLNMNYLVQQFHRADLRKLIAAADALFTSTPSQAEHLRRLLPTSAVQVLPVGSNIRPLAAAKQTRDERLAVLFGRQSSRIKTLQKLCPELEQLLSAKRIERVIVVGGGENEDVEERAFFREGFEARGAQPEPEISKLLAGAAFGISAQDELSLHKSGTFMAYAAHGLNVISPFAKANAPEPACWLTHPQELLAGLSPNELKTRAENLRAWQERVSSWPGIARSFAEALQLETAS